MCMYHTCSVSLYSVVNTWCNWVNSRSCADHLINAQHCGRWLQLRVDGELGKITGKLQEGEPAPLLLPCLTLTLPYPYPAYLTLLRWYSYLSSTIQKHWAALYSGDFPLCVFFILICNPQHRKEECASFRIVQSLCLWLCDQVCSFHYVSGSDFSQNSETGRNFGKVNGSTGSTDSHDP